MYRVSNQIFIHYSLRVPFSFNLFSKASTAATVNQLREKKANRTDGSYQPYTAVLRLETLSCSGMYQSSFYRHMLSVILLHTVFFQNSVIGE